MSEHGRELQLEGVVRAYRYTAGRGKPFLGVKLECSDGKVWIISYDEQSPFHAFADRRVLVSGEQYQPKKGSFIVSLDRSRPLGHFRATTMRLVEISSSSELAEVGPSQHLSGRFERRANANGSTLFFVTDRGDTLLVVNDPAGAIVGRHIEVLGYPVQLSPSIPRPPGRWFWIICPCSMEDLWVWRERRA
jgi:hypothetical protein